MKRFAIFLVFSLLCAFSAVLAFADADGNGTAVVTAEEYGAVGDGVHDDHAAIEAALNSGCDKIVFGSGKTYLISEPVIARYGNVELDGNGACILWDSESYFEDWKTFVFNGESSRTLKNIYIHDLKFHTPNVGNDPEKKAPDKRIVGVQLLLLHCENVRVENCEFFAYEGKGNENFSDGGRGVTNLWAWGHTDGLTIERCEFVNECHADGMGYGTDVIENIGGGGNVWLSGDGDSDEENYLLNVSVLNNSFVKCNHDESISAWNGNFKNVSIKNNSFSLIDRGGGFVPNDVQFAFGYRDNFVEDFVFSDNLVNAESRDCLFAVYASEGSDGARIENNEIRWTHVGEKPSYNGLVVSSDSACNTRVYGNSVSVDSEYPDMLYRLFGNTHVDFRDNDVRVLCNIHHVCDIEDDAQAAPDTSLIHENRFVFDGIFRFFENGAYKYGFLYQGYDFCDNEVLLNGKHEKLNLFSYWERSLSRSPKLSGNAIRLKYAPKAGSAALMTDGTSFGDHAVDFTNNEIYTASRAEEGDYFFSYLIKGRENSEQCVDMRGTKSNFLNCVHYYENTLNPLVKTDSGDAKTWTPLPPTAACSFEIENGSLKYSVTSPANPSFGAPLAAIVSYDTSGKMDGAMLLSDVSFSEYGALSLAETAELSDNAQRLAFFLLQADTFCPLCEPSSIL